MGIIKLYKTYAIYEEKVEFNLVNGQVPPFKRDIELSFKIDEVKNKGAFPNNEGKYEAIATICDNGVIAEWDNINWSLKVINSNNQNKIKCNIDFITKYKELILNGADPVLKDGLIPVTIAGDGTVKKEGIANKWYSYVERQWANAVILVSNPTKIYNVGDVISQNDIESYFVWIPKYKYKLWTVTTDTSGVAKKIDIVFGLGNTNDTALGECQTPGWKKGKYDGSNVSGATGNCEIGDYMTHPAFLAFNTNGIWVGKFETGNSSNKVIIKPNVSSWRNIAIGNSFMTSYNYKRNLNSHMMKNTEWGAVAYLTNSIYGRCIGSICSEITNNNSSSYITGMTNTIGYFSGSVGASTTGNRSGIYDMSGIAWDQVASNLNDSPSSSGFSSFSTYRNYIDKYTGAGVSARILGDATGEASGWNGDGASFIHSTYPWFYRGGKYNGGTSAGIFAFDGYYGGADDGGFRVVLAF